MKILLFTLLFLKSLLCFALSMSDPRVQHPMFHPAIENDQLGAELTVGLTPSHSKVQGLVEGFINLSALSQTTKPPKPRRPGMHHSDVLNMMGFKILVERGLIQKGSLILSDTGHDIPTAAFFMRQFHQEFTIQSAFYFPSPLYKNPGNYERIIAQAQGWNDELAYWQNYHAAKENLDILFLGLEAHRKDYDGEYLYELPIEKLPTREELQELGLNKVIFVTEAHPDAPLEKIMRKVRKDTKAYIDQLNLPTTYLGNDCRRGNGCEGLLENMRWNHTSEI